MSLDEPMRKRLGALAQQEPAEALSELARARVEQRALSVRELSARRVRSGWLVAAALALLGVIAAARMEHTFVAQAPAQVATEPVPHEWLVAPAVPPGAALDGSTVRAECIEESSHAWRSGAQGLRLELGERALLVAPKAARVAGGLLPSCDVAVELTSGRVDVLARKLEGKRLSVSTPFGSVHVKGTVFSVRVVPERAELHVSVDEGLVGVETLAGEQVDVTPGRTLIVRSDGLRSAAYGLRARNTLRAQLGLSARGPAAEPHQAAANTFEVEVREPSEETRVWQPGALSPPSVPLEPGTSRTEEGRPMSKPVLTEGEEL